MATTRQKNTSSEGTTASEGMANDIKNTASDAMDQAKEKVSQAAGQAQQKAKSQLTDRKDQVADGMDSIAYALRQTSQQLEGQDASMVGNYVTKAADTISNISHQVREKDVDQLLHEVEGFARREPAIALGSAFAIGVIAARFLKSSNQRRFSNTSEQSGYGYSGNQYGTQYNNQYNQGYNQGSQTRSDWSGNDSTRYPTSGAGTNSGTSNYSTGGMNTPDMGEAEDA